MAIILKPENLARLVFFIRSEKVMLDSDLATLYGVEARALNQAVARNHKRFPADFMFQLTPREYESLRSQTVILKEGGTTDDLSQTVMSSPGAPIKLDWLNQSSCCWTLILEVKEIHRDRSGLDRVACS